MRSWVEFSQLSLVTEVREGYREGSICVICERWIGSGKTTWREGKWKSVYSEGQFTSRVWGYPASWSMLGIFSLATWQMESALPWVNCYRKRNSTGMPWLTTKGWEHMWVQNAQRLVWNNQKDSNAWCCTRVAGGLASALYCSLTLQPALERKVNYSRRSSAPGPESRPWFCSWPASCSLNSTSLHFHFCT